MDNFDRISPVIHFYPYLQPTRSHYPHYSKENMFLKTYFLSLYERVSRARPPRGRFVCERCGKKHLDKPIAAASEVALDRVKGEERQDSTQVRQWSANRPIPEADVQLRVAPAA
jgi:hypothetical protein